VFFIWVLGPTLGGQSDVNALPICFPETDRLNKISARVRSSAWNAEKNSETYRTMKNPPEKSVLFPCTGKQVKRAGG
jgi:hypothetical protein